MRTLAFFAVSEQIQQVHRPLGLPRLRPRVSRVPRMPLVPPVPLGLGTYRATEKPSKPSSGRGRGFGSASRSAKGVSMLGPKNHCKSCRSPQREELDRALIAGEPLRSLEKRFGMAKTSIARHARRHLTAALAAAAGRADAHGDELLARLGDIESRARRLARKAEASGQVLRGDRGDSRAAPAGGASGQDRRPADARAGPADDELCLGVRNGLLKMLPEPAAIDVTPEGDEP